MLLDLIGCRVEETRVRGQRSEWELGITICHSAPSGGHSSRSHCLLVEHPLSPASWMSHTPAASSWSGPGAQSGVGGNERRVVVIIMMVQGDHYMAPITCQAALKGLDTQFMQPPLQVGICCYMHYTDEVTEAQRSKDTCPQSHSSKWQS